MKATSSTLLIMCLFGCQLISTSVVVWMCGFTIDTSNVGFSDLCDPSLYMKLLRFHVAWKGLIESLLGFYVGLGMYG